MKEQLAFCGIECMKCPLFIATKENSDEKRRQVAILWKELVPPGLKPEEMNCDGCLSERTCNPNCTIRVCAHNKDVINCAYCTEYVCTNLARLFRTETRAHEKLDEIRKGLKLIDEKR